MKKEMSEALTKALDDLARVEIVYSVEEITLKKVEGRMILHLRSGGEAGNA